MSMKGSSVTTAWIASAPARGSMKSFSKENFSFAPASAIVDFAIQ